MIAFVIKNKEGKYRASEVKNFSGFYYYTDKLVQAEFFSDYELAKVSCLESEEPVKITIAETEDLEQDIKLDNSFWKQECDSLQETLKEKYKEIELLKMSVSFEQEHKNKALDRLKQIRHEVCDKVKKVIDYYSEWHEQGYIIDMVAEDLLKEIDKIEQGE